MERTEESLRPKRIAAKKVLTYNINYDQVGYYEQRELQRALKCSLIEAEAAKNINTNTSNKKVEEKNYNFVKKNQSKSLKLANRKFPLISNTCDNSNNNSLVDENLDGNTEADAKISKKEFIDNKCSSDSITNVFCNKKLNKLTTEEFLNYLCFRESNILSFNSSAKNEEIAVNCENLNNIFGLNLLNEKEQICENLLNKKLNENSEAFLDQYTKLSMVSNKNISSSTTKTEKNCVVFSQNENFIQNLDETSNSISPLKKSKKKIEVISNGFTLNIKNEHQNNLNAHSFLNNKSSIKLESQISNKLSKNKNLHRPTRKAKPNVSLYDFHIEFEDEEVCSHKKTTKLSHKQSSTKKQNTKLFSIQTCIKNEIRKKLLQKSINLSKKYSSKNANKNNGFKKSGNSVNPIKKASKKLFNRSNKCIKNRKNSNKTTIQKLNRKNSLNRMPSNVKISKNELLRKSEIIIRNLYKLRQYLNLKKQQITLLILEKNEQDNLISSKITALRLMSKDLQNSIIDSNSFDINTYDPLTISGLLSTTFSGNFSCKTFLSNLIFSELVNSFDCNEKIFTDFLNEDDNLNDEALVSSPSSPLIES